MSMNLYLRGYGMIDPQTPSEVTYRLLKKGNTESILEAVCAYRHEQLDPPELTGKDARNAYLQSQRDQRIEEIEEGNRRLRDFVRKTHGAQFHAV